MRKRIVLILILLFFVVSVVIAVLAVKEPLEDYALSSELTFETETNDGIETNKYVDSDGHVTYAGDRGFAILVRHRDENNRVTLEYYLDENEEPIERWGTYGVSYSYDDNATPMTRTTCYLDSNLEPMEISSGYCYVVHSYSADTRDYIDMYYDVHMNSAHNYVDCYGIQYIYEEDLPVQYMWLDADGAPMNCKNGYCSTIRTFDDNNRVITEMYFDVDGSAATSSLGEYGIYITYDDEGRRSSVTYIDEFGNPMVNRAGYSRVDYTYNPYGGVETERYYGLDGAPSSTGKGWYGKRHDGNRIYYLDSTGKDILSIDSILDNYPFMVALMGVLVCIIFVFAPRKVNFVVAVLYFFFIMYETILYRYSHPPTANMELFWSYKEFWRNEGLRIDILNNIWLFVPYSLGLTKVFGIDGSKRIRDCKVFLALMFLPLAIEIAQYVFGIGLSELDDLVSNGLGELIGIGIWYLVVKNKPSAK